MTSPLSRTEWHKARIEHHNIVRPWVQPRLDRKSRQEKHPVDDFLFEYYPISPSKILAWHPGFGHTLEIDETDVELFNLKFYSFTENTVTLSETFIADSVDSMQRTIEFLSLIRSRQAVNGCFGLHEWAMVLGEDHVRHDSWPLRLPQSEIRKTIDEIGLRCTHFDAFRFFTDESRPLNPIQLTRADQIQVEQPGCLHANMDLYKIVFSHSPILGSAVLRQAFELARDIRTVDMQVAPYDLHLLGVHPIPVETVSGRAEFARLQREFAQRADALRSAVIEQLTHVLNAPQLVRN